MSLLTEKYKAWVKHPENYTAEQVLNQVVADLEWLDEEQTKNYSIPAVNGCLSNITFSYKHPTGKKIGKLEYDEDMLILRYKGGYIMNPELDKLMVLNNR